VEQRLAVRQVILRGAQGRPAQGVGRGVLRQVDFQVMAVLGWEIPRMALPAWQVALHLPIREDLILLHCTPHRNPDNDNEI